MLVVGCVPSTVEGSGAVGGAEFSYAADNCTGELRGHFNLNDVAADVRFHATIEGITQDCVGCAHCADGQDELLFTYKNQSSAGDGYGCYLDNVAEVTVTSGVYAGYSVTGPIENPQGGQLIPCE